MAEFENLRQFLFKFQRELSARPQVSSGSDIYFLFSRFVDMEKQIFVLKGIHNRPFVLCVTILSKPFAWIGFSLFCHPRLNISDCFGSLSLSFVGSWADLCCYGFEQTSHLSTTWLNLCGSDKFAQVHITVLLILSCPHLVQLCWIVKRTLGSAVLVCVGSPVREKWYCNGRQAGLNAAFRACCCVCSFVCCRGLTLCVCICVTCLTAFSSAAEERHRKYQGKFLL